MTVLDSNVDIEGLKQKVKNAQVSTKLVVVS